MLHLEEGVVQVDPLLDVVRIQEGLGGAVSGSRTGNGGAERDVQDLLPGICVCVKTGIGSTSIHLIGIIEILISRVTVVTFEQKCN